MASLIPSDRGRVPRQTLSSDQILTRIVELNRRISQQTQQTQQQQVLPPQFDFTPESSPTFRNSFPPPPPPSFYTNNYPGRASSPPPPPPSFYANNYPTRESSPPPPPPSFYFRQSPQREERKLPVSSPRSSPRSPISRSIARPIVSPRSLLNSRVNAYLLENYGTSLPTLQTRANECKVDNIDRTDKIYRSCVQIGEDEKLSRTDKLQQIRQRQAQYLECASSRDLVNSAFATMGNLNDREQLRVNDNHRYAAKMLRDEAKSCGELAARLDENILRDRALRDLHLRADIASDPRNIRGVTSSPSQFQVQLPNNPLGFENSVPFEWIPSQWSTRSVLNR